MKNESAGAWGQPGGMGDSLTELLRRGARDLIEQAVEVEWCKRRRKNIPLKRPDGPAVAVQKCTVLKSSLGSGAMTAFSQGEPAEGV
jgi:hypothetical protein